MGMKAVFTRILAMMGTFMMWFPIVLPIALSAAMLAKRGVLWLDYLMPVEMFPYCLMGGGVLFWSAIRARSQRALIGWSVVAAAFFFFGSQALVTVSGLASGATEASGFWRALVLTFLILFDLAVIASGVGGIRLLRDLYKNPGLQTRNA